MLKPGLKLAMSVIATKFQPEEVSYTGINLYYFITACTSFVYSEGMTFVNYMLF